MTENSKDEATQEFMSLAEARVFVQELGGDLVAAIKSAPNEEEKNRMYYAIHLVKMNEGR